MCMRAISANLLIYQPYDQLNIASSLVLYDWMGSVAFELKDTPKFMNQLNASDS
jgi:hypothetical protein